MCSTLIAAVVCIVGGTEWPDRWCGGQEYAAVMCIGVGQSGRSKGECTRTKWEEGVHLDLREE